MTFREVYEVYYSAGIKARELRTIPVTEESRAAESAFWKAQYEFLASAVRVAKGEETLT